MSNAQKSEKVKSGDNLALSILGAFVGGMIATLPWILAYVYVNMMYAIFTIVVAMGALKGYELMKGKLDKKLPYIIALISFICITLATLVIIPNLLIIKETGKTSLDLFKLLYSFDEFKSAIIHDYIFTIIFTIIGVGGVFSNVKRQIEEGNEKIDLSRGAYGYVPSNEEIEEVKKILIDRNAISKDSSMDKKEFKEKIVGMERTFKYLLNRGIIVSKNGGYYYSEKNEFHPGKRFLVRFLLIFAITLIVMIASVVLIVTFS